MRSIPDWSADLSAESSLWEAYKKARSSSRTKFNRKIRIYIYPILLVFIIILSWSAFEDHQTLSAIAALSSSAISLISTIIGFIIAGLAIFMTLSDKRLLVELAKTKQINTSISSFKYIYFNLFSVFVTYIFSLVFYIILYTASSMSIVASDLCVFGVIFPVANMLNGFFLAAMFVIGAECLIRLKSFIWNIYTIFISMLVVWDYLEDEQRTK